MTPTAATNQVSKRTPLMGRPPLRQATIVTDIRQRIVDGELSPGARLPNRSDLEQSFAASPITVQRALDQLVQDGFVTVRGRLGSYVADRPPHLNRFAVVFPSAPDDKGWLRFWTALSNEVSRVEQTGERLLPQYFHVDGHTDSEDYQRLVQDQECHRIAGIVFASSPYTLLHSPLMQNTGLPRVAFASHSVNGEPIVFTDIESFLDRALDYAAAEGRRRVAFLNPPGLFAAEHLKSEASQRGLSTQPYWLLSTSVQQPVAAVECIHLLMHAGQAERPDVLIISDDNLVQHATEGLVAAGVRVPEDVLVIAHGNFPWLTDSLVPATRLGFDARQVLRACLDLVDAQQNARAAPSQVCLPAHFAKEVPAEILFTGEERVANRSFSKSRTHCLK